MIVKIEADRHTERRQFLLRLLTGLRAAPDDREDLAQQALLRFFSRGYAERGLDVKAENALLARIGYSTFIDACRKRRHTGFGEVPPEIEDPDNREASLDSIREVQELVALAGLVDDEITLLESRYARGLSLVAIAEQTGLHVNTVRRRLENILGKLRRQAKKTYTQTHSVWRSES